MKISPALSLFGIFLIVTMTSPNLFAEKIYKYSQFAQRHDTNRDGRISRQEFKGRSKRFEQLDENKDGYINENEYVNSNTKRQTDSNENARIRQSKLPAAGQVLRDLEYAIADGQSLKLDLYLPVETDRPSPLLIWIHGGGWANGDKTQINSASTRLTMDGYAVASINYRLGGANIHPKQIHDAKGAVRWLRANATRFRIDTTRIAAGGGSAGGHLALLLGLSGSVTELEGDVGGNLGESSDVQAIVDLYGVSSMREYADSKPAFQRNKSADFFRSASPVEYISEDDPPLLIVHGDNDQTVPVEQSYLLHERYQAAGLYSSLHIVNGGEHGGRVYQDETRYQLIRLFLDTHTKEEVKSATTILAEEEISNGIVVNNDTTTDRAELKTDKSLHGLHWMIGPNNGLFGPEKRFTRLLDKVDGNLSSNEYITGACSITHWNLIEAKPGKFNFDHLDRVIDRVRKHNRYYKLAINPGIYSPDWLYEKGTQAFTTLGSNPDRQKIYQKAIKIPIPWNETYQKFYFRLLNEIANRYGTDTAFRGIVLTVATFMSPEWYLPHSVEDRRQWAKLEDYSGKILQAWKKGIDHFAAIFPNQILILEASSYPIGLKELGDAIVDYGATEYADRFAVQMNQLTGRFDQGNRPTYMKLLEYKEKYRSGIQLGLQNVKGWRTKDYRKRQGSMEMTAFNFVQANGDYWELWHSDGNDREICKILFDLREEARQTGLKRLKNRLVSEGKYKPQTSPAIKD